MPLCGTEKMECISENYTLATYQGSLFSRINSPLFFFKEIQTLIPSFPRTYKIYCKV